MPQSPLQLIRFIRDLIEVANEAAVASKNDYGRSYLHVTHEKIDHACDWTEKLIEAIKKG